MRCPVCRAENAQGPQCRRCRADLSLLFDLEDQRDRLLHGARAFAREGDAEAALRLASRAHELRQGEDSARLLAVTRLLQGDFAGALEAYTSAACGLA
ncbi:MAG: hypothetical protein L0Z62_39675 [Gemmataceae bacterium]|nr:hypothetical protein [Gemmataceae bacterium]